MVFVNIDKEFAKQPNFKSVQFPVHKKGYTKIEKQNNISINMFGYEDKTPYCIYTSKQIFKKYVDLVLLCFNKSF